MRPEIAVFLTRITDLPHWRTIDKKKTVRVYFGNEFCEERIPKRVELEAACAAVREAGLPLSFVTPPVSDRGCEVLMDRLKELQTGMPGSEVVVNDWGVLRLLYHELPSLVPVLGRLMNKLLRDPRITPHHSRPDVLPDPLRALRRCSLSISAYRHLLSRFGVKRVELDNLYQGIEMDFEAWSLLRSLYIPFGYVTMGRICLPGNQHLPSDQKFATPSGGCPRPCLRSEIDLINPQQEPRRTRPSRSVVMLFSIDSPNGWYPVGSPGRRGRGRAWCISRRFRSSARQRDTSQSQDGDDEASCAHQSPGRGRDAGR